MKQKLKDLLFKLFHTRKTKVFLGHNPKTKGMYSFETLTLSIRYIKSDKEIIDKIRSTNDTATISMLMDLLDPRSIFYVKVRLEVDDYDHHYVETYVYKYKYPDKEQFINGIKLIRGEA